MRMLMLYVSGVFYVCTVLCVSFLVHVIVHAVKTLADLQLCWVLRRASSSEETAHLPLVAQLLY